MPRSPSPVSVPTGKAEYKLLKLLDQARWAGLKTRSGVTGRFKKTLYWLETMARELAPGASRFDRRMALHAELPRTLTQAGWEAREAELLATRILFAWGALDYWGCYGENFNLLRRGRAPKTSRGKDPGRTIEIDHSVPVAWAPSLFNHPANLIPVPLEDNRTKGSKVKPRDLEIAQVLASHGRLAASELTTVEDAHINGWRKPSDALPSDAKKSVATMPSSPSPSTPVAAFAGGWSAAPLDPRLLVSKIVETSEGLDQMLARWRVADSGMSGLHAIFNEQTDRVVRFARCRLNEAEADLDLSDRASRHTTLWRDRQADLWLKIKAAGALAAKSGGRARDQLKHWEKVLERMERLRQKAEKEAREAEEALAEAEDQLDRARQRLSEEEEALEEARDTTVHAGYDRDGNEIRKSIDTTRFERAVERAEEQVDACESERDEAAEELEEAEEKLREAEARVTAATEAVELSGAAVDRAMECQTSAGSARHHGERMDEEILRLADLAERMASIARKSLQAAEETLAYSKRAATSTQAAGVLLVSCLRAFEESEFARRRFAMEMEPRLQALRNL